MRIYSVLLVAMLLASIAWSSDVTPVGVGPSEPLSPLLHERLVENEPTLRAATPPEVVRLASQLEQVIDRWPEAVIPHLEHTELALSVATAVFEEQCGNDTFTPNDGRPRCLWVDGWNSDIRKAGLLAAVAYYEGARFAKYVDDGSCNAWMTRVYNHLPLADDAYIEIGGKRFNLLKFGNCDGGRAWSLWQIHPDALERPKFEGLELKDRWIAASVAIGIIRLSMRGRGDLCWYTGESPEAGCPKAVERLEFARKSLHRAGLM